MGSNPEAVSRGKGCFRWPLVIGCEQVPTVPVLSTAQKRLCRQYMSPELLCSLFAGILCEDQPAATGFSGGKKSMNRLFIRLSTFPASAFPSSLNLHMHFGLHTLERIVSVGSSNVEF